MVDNKTK